ncbi:CPBP family intramembrane glutamic endopeptidase [Dactylosporangium sp. NPDC000521]|uniref:CPBP family intramembrane glutamic endopeptidase n=1 Tax=Dactylosporangium sp. NPDC000521 TaxID=3363975 RepID=UPI0036AADEC5
MLRLPEPGTPFHRLAHTAAHRWWRPVVGTLVLAAAYLLVEWLGGMLGFGEPLDTWLYRTSVGSLGAAALLLARAAQARRAGTLASVLGRPRWHWLGLCLLEAAVTVVMLVAASAVLVWAIWAGPNARIVGGVGGEFVLPFLAFIGPTVVVAVAAELVFRGWLLQAVGAYGGGPWLAITVQAVLFAAAFYTVGPWTFAEGLTLGAVLGWLAVRTGGLEAGIALVVCLDLLAAAREAIREDLYSDGYLSDLQWQFFALDLVVTLAYAATVALHARRRGIAAVTPALAAAAVPAPV